jgi:cytidylate kinase
MNKLQLVERAIRRFEQDLSQRSAWVAPGPPRRVVTIARLPGSGGRRIAELLADETELPLWDKQILDLMASDVQGSYQRRMLDVLDESARSEVENVLASIAGHVSSSSYMHQLPRVVHLICRDDAILLGRGAHLMLPSALRVLISASMTTRIENVMRREVLDESEARKRIALADQQRSSFIHELRKQLGQTERSDAPALECDLEINTDRVGTRAAVELIRLAMNHLFARPMGLF